MKRRTFIRNTALVGGLGLVMPKHVLAQLASEESETEELVLLHTNDVHSRIDAFPDNDPKFPGRGGVAKRMSLINAIRKKEKHVVLLDCGDIFQGTPYFNLFGGEPELKAMSLMNYDAATMGNHDFDNGLEGFHAVMHHANFPFICTNYNFDHTLLRNKTNKVLIIQKGNLKIGVIGLGIELDGLVQPALFGDTVYLDPIQTAEKYGRILKEQKGCDLVVCLSHLGYEYDNDKVSDRVLAAKTSFIDIILGGHTHTFLYKPVMVSNAQKRPVLINQVGWGGINLGYIKLQFRKNKIHCENSVEISYIAEENLEIA